MIEYVHVTVHYACGHDMCRPVRRDDESTMSQVSNGIMFDYHNCKHCTATHLRALERQMERANKL
jgi:hypothetical protein